MHFDLHPGALPLGYAESMLPIAEAKAACYIAEGEDAFDDLLDAFRASAIDLIEQMAGIYLARRTGIEWVGGGFAAILRLPFGPSIAVDSVEYDSASGPVTLPGTAWQMGPHGRLLPAHGTCWPTDCTGAVRVTYSAGHADVRATAPALVQAARMMLVHMFDNRDAVVVGTITGEVPLGVQTIITTHRMPSL